MHFNKIRNSKSKKVLFKVHLDPWLVKNYSPFLKARDSLLCLQGLAETPRAESELTRFTFHYMCCN
jgi:hypothetical protein